MAKGLAVFLSLFVFSVSLSAEIVTEDLWINEFHYDNDGGDTGEFVEIVVPEGFDVSGLLLEFYNGSGGATYDTAPGSGWTLSSTTNGFSFFVADVAGIQNGAPDGLGLSSSDGLTLYQFLSYEGTLVATNGNWSGETSTDVGVSETASTPIGESLQLTGTGSIYSDFTWAGPAANTYGLSNTGQTAIPEPLGFGICLAFMLTGLRRHRQAVCV